MPAHVNRLEQPPHPLLINGALNRILQSTPFHGSKQCQLLLKYLVDHALSRQDEELKERTIGVEVFGRPPDYNTGEDAIVRARVGEVRKRLAQYYHSDEAEGSAFEIVIAAGAYRPTFVPRHDTASGTREGLAEHRAAVHVAETAPLHAPEEDPKPEAASAVSKPPRKVRWGAWGLGAVLACVVVSAAWLGLSRLTKNDLDLFWEPILESEKPAVIYMGTAPVYVPTPASGEKMRTLIPPDEQKQPMTEWRPPSIDNGQVLTTDEIVVNRTDYVSVGDIDAVVDVGRLLNLRHRNFELRWGSNLPFEDLRGSPVVLTGGGGNYWTLDMTRNLPFYLDRSLRIRERGGQSRVWSTALWSDHTITEDYAIVARLLESNTGAPMVILAGITTCAARAAGEFVTNPAHMMQLGNIPRDAIEHKNLEFVLHTTLVDCTPTSMNIVELRYW